MQRFDVSDVNGVRGMFSSRSGHCRVLPLPAQPHMSLCDLQGQRLRFLRSAFLFKALCAFPVRDSFCMHFFPKSAQAPPPHPSLRVGVCLDTRSVNSCDLLCQGSLELSQRLSPPKTAQNSSRPTNGSTPPALPRSGESIRSVRDRVMDDQRLRVLMTNPLAAYSAFGFCEVFQGWVGDHQPNKSDCPGESHNES